MTERNEQVQDVRIDLINASENRARLLMPERVMQLADDIEANGLEHPVLVRPDADGCGYTLVYGGHRLAAFAELGRETIPAIVRMMTDDEARLEEVRENLLGPNLTVLDRALHMKVEKDIYEAHNPDTKHGGDRRSDQVRNVAHLKKQRFTKEMADVLGCGDDAIKRAIKIANAITRELHAEIHGTALADNQAQLLALAKQPPSDRLQIVRLMKEHGKTKVMDGFRLMKGVDPSAPPPESRKDAWMRKMNALWATGDKAWRRAFLEDIAKGGHHK